MPRLRSLIKRALAYALYYSGALWLYAELALRNRAVVLMYHRVLPAGADTFSDEGIIVSPRTFEANVRFLRRHFAPLTAAEFRQCFERARFPRRACLVTFDDGWQDNAEHALPILRAWNVPATIFIATGYVGTASMFWQERLTRELFTITGDPDRSRWLQEEIRIFDAPPENDLDRRRKIRKFVTRLKSDDPIVVDRIVRRVSAAASELGNPPAPPGCDQFLSWDSVARLASTGLVTIGTHAHSHVPLTRLGCEGTSTDLLRSMSEMERHLIPRPWLCAYPNGDHDEAVLEGARRAGLHLGFTTEAGRVAPGCEPLSLPRVNIHDSAALDPPLFLCRLLGIF